MFQSMVYTLLGLDLTMIELLEKLQEPSFCLYAQKSMVYKAFVDASEMEMNQLEFFVILDKLCLFTTFKIALDVYNNKKNSRIQLHLDLWSTVATSDTIQSLELIQTLVQHERNRYTLEDKVGLIVTYPDYPGIVESKLKLKNVYLASLSTGQLQQSQRTFKMKQVLSILLNNKEEMLLNELCPISFEFQPGMDCISIKNEFGVVVDYKILDCCKGNGLPISNHCLCSQKGFIKALRHKIKNNCSVIGNKVYKYDNTKSTCIIE